MFYDKISSLVDTNFSDWLLEEMNKRGWSQADLARASGLNRQSVSDYVNLRRTNPEPEALVSLANAFKLPPETVFRAAGLLPQQTEETEIIQQISHLTKELPQYEQQDILEFIKMRHRLAKERGNNESKRTRNKPAIP